MYFYQANLAAFGVFNTCFLVYQHRTRGYKTRHDDFSQDCGSQSMASKFQQRFLLVYTLAVAADWLQGPYTYAVYKYEKQLSEKTVALLYASGFVSGAMSAPFAGQLADRYGRRAACLVYCFCYSLTCLTMLSDDLPILCVGRIFGGIATTLLFSVFEAWMIAEYRALRLDSTILHLSDIFGNMTTASGIIAICSGIIGDSLIQYSGSRIWPFFASLTCCFGAALFMLALWRENSGANVSTQTSVTELQRGMLATLRNRKVMALGMTSCCFEGAMYLFVFFWSAALKSARAKSGSQGELPFGLIFSSFMCAMMTGSTILSSRNTLSSSGSARSVLMWVLVLASASLSGAAVLGEEHVLFWAFCVLEGCVGAYFPSMAFIKSDVIADNVRGGVYSILRLPLNMFVVIAHSLDREGDEHRNNVFLTCAGLLLMAFLIMRQS